MSDDTRYSNWVTLWAHHNSTQFQWPSIILSSVFVAISLLVSNVEIETLANTSNWGKEPTVQYGAALLLLLIGFGTMVMLYTMARARKIMLLIEDKISDINKKNNYDNDFSITNHPKTLIPGSRLIWVFMACLDLVALVLGSLFYFGLNKAVFFSLILIGIIWIALVYTAFKKPAQQLLPKDKKR